MDGINYSQYSDIKNTTTDPTPYHIVFPYAYSGTQVTFTVRMTTTDTLFFDWGDGTSTTITGEVGVNKTATSNYANNGNYNIRLKGSLDKMNIFICANDFIDINIADFTQCSSLTQLTLTCTGTYGSIDNLPSTLKELTINYGEPEGSVANLPDGLVTLQIQYVYNNEITGDIADFPSHLINWDWIAKNGLSGSLNDLPAPLTHLCVNIVDPNGIEQPSEDADGQFTGNISLLKTSHPDMYYFEGNNLGDSITGSINDLGSKMKYWGISNFGKANITGDFAHFPSTLEYALFAWQDEIAGNIENLPSSVTRIFIQDCPGIIYNSGAIPSWTLLHLGITVDNNWTSAMVDAFLIACAASLASNNLKPHINLKFTGMGARTSASDAAVATLTGNQYEVATN